MRILLLLMLLTAGAAAQACPPSLDFALRPLLGEKPVRLCDRYAGKVLLVVNTASKCGFTPQYAGLEQLSRELGPRGLVVLGFPSNDFAGQEPGTEAEIGSFCRSTYGVQFPMFEKTIVRGAGAHPLYRYLAATSGEEPGWNFHKYLIDRDGKVAGSYSSRVAPESDTLRSALEKLL
jgi:glutathione peroxidase